MILEWPLTEVVLKTPDHCIKCLKRTLSSVCNSVCCCTYADSVCSPVFDCTVSLAVSKSDSSWCRWCEESWLLGRQAPDIDKSSQSTTCNVVLYSCGDLMQKRRVERACPRAPPTSESVSAQKAVSVRHSTATAMRTSDCIARCELNGLQHYPNGCIVALQAVSAKISQVRVRVEKQDCPLCAR